LPNPERYQWTRVASDLDQPVELVDPGDGRLFLVEKPGLIRILQDGRILAAPFLDIRDRVGSRGSEQGLLGLAFHPRYGENGLFFVDYTDTNGDTAVARFRVSSDPNRADPSSGRVLLHIDQPYPNHNGGEVAFGPDGYLYIGMGDGGSEGDPQGNGQRLDTLLGKLLRIDVDGADPYAIPSDNPFAAGGGRAEIWAYGLRNPWRFTFDPRSGDLYVADVGQNRWEEIDFQPAGSRGGVNYGWKIREGAHAYAGASASGLTDPVTEYGHDQGCAVSGGVVIRGQALPDWGGVYLYGDYCSGLIWGLRRMPGGTWQNALLFQTGFNISAFGEDHLGNAYVVDLSGAAYQLTLKP
jgi:glucose/arabinose dehydrogenase